MNDFRSVEKVVKAVPVIDGAGVHIKRAIGTRPHCLNSSIKLTSYADFLASHLACSHVYPHA